MLQVISDIIAREGGFVNNPNDLGGATKYGITQKTLSDYRGVECSVEDMRALTVEEAGAIYEKIYAKPFEVWAQHIELYALIVDSAVQHGVGRVQGWLADIIKTTSDPNPVYKFFLRKRMQFYGEIITARPKNAEFAKGWMVRLSTFIR